jgi:hypothetical protein
LADLVIAATFTHRMGKAAAGPGLRPDPMASALDQARATLIRLERDLAG